jgi:hypothetical protein
VRILWRRSRHRVAGGILRGGGRSFALGRRRRGIPSRCLRGEVSGMRKIDGIGEGKHTNSIKSKVLDKLHRGSSEVGTASGGRGRVDEVLGISPSSNRKKGLQLSVALLEEVQLLDTAVNVGSVIPMIISSLYIFARCTKLCRVTTASATSRCLSPRGCLRAFHEIPRLSASDNWKSTTYPTSFQESFA